MTDSPKKRALIVRNFKNEGTGERFVKDATPLLDAGTFANYEAAGLVTTPPPVKAASKAQAVKTAKPRAKAKAAASKPKSKPTAAPAPAPIVPVQPDTPPAGGLAAD